jgi:uncharacterized membrane protein
MRRRVPDDEGSLIPLIAFYFVVAATLILVVTDASKYYLARRSLQSAADAAALASAQSVSSNDIYAGGASGQRLTLDGDVCEALDAYGQANHLASRFEKLSMKAYADDSPGTCVAAGADHVTVVATSTVSLPLVDILGTVDTKFADGVKLTVVAHAALRCDTC